MLNLEGFMNIRDLKQQGWTVSAIAEQLNLDRKTVRRYLVEPPQPYKREQPAPCKIDAAPHLPAGTMGTGSSQRQQTGGRDSRPRLWRWLLTVEAGSGFMAGGRAGTSLRTFRN